MDIIFFSSFAIYLTVLVGVGVIFAQRQKNASDFMVGGRTLNYWVTAIATHTTDMSTWLFMAFPGLIYTQGIFGCWVAIGLVLGMYLTWKFVAPKLRVATEKYQANTLSSFFAKRFNDSSGLIEAITALVTIIFFTFYISSGIIGLGRTLEVTFSMNYHTAITIGTLVVGLYTLLGGFIAVAWNDFLQGMFVLVMLLIVPVYALWLLGGVGNVLSVIQAKNISLSLFPDYSSKTFLHIIISLLGWGLGYFGLPHVLVNFLGIQNVHEIKKAQRMGIAWQIITLVSATLIGLIGIAYFAQTGLQHSEFVFVTMAKTLFAPFMAGLVLCAILAAATSTMDSQILVSASTIAEDLYKRFYKKNVSGKQLLFVSRISGIIVIGVSFLLAFNSNESIYSLVYYAWSGLGGAFGPLLLASFYAPFDITKEGAIAGIITGAATAAIWPHMSLPMMASLIGAYVISFTSIYVVSMVTGTKRSNVYSSGNSPSNS